jgi:hypothetical protein
MWIARRTDEEIMCDRLATYEVGPRAVVSHQVRQPVGRGAGRNSRSLMTHRPSSSTLRTVSRDFDAIRCTAEL